MIFTPDRDRLRQAFAIAWAKRCGAEPMTPLELQIAAVIELHPEYQPLIEDPDFMRRDFTPEDGQGNPYLHMAMHLTLREQRETDRPPGARALLTRLTRRIGDAHAAEHAAMECLGEALWHARAGSSTLDPRAYLESLRSLVAGPGRRDRKRRPS